MENNELLIKCATLTIIFAVITVIGDAYTKELEGLLKMAFAGGYGALAWEASRQERFAEALICNGMMAIYFAAALNHGFPNSAEQIELVWDWVMVTLSQKAEATPSP